MKFLRLWRSYALRMVCGGEFCLILGGHIVRFEIYAKEKIKENKISNVAKIQIMKTDWKCCASDARKEKRTKPKSKNSGKNMQNWTRNN